MTQLGTEPPSALHQARRIAAGELSASRLVRGHLETVERLDPGLSAFVRVDHEQALATAEVRDRERPRSRLHGVPVAVKDNICTAGLQTSCASQILDGFVPPYDATAVARLRDAGLVVLGKTNLDEFAMGSSTEHSMHGPTHNPWDPDRVPGGSSGGSAAAVAAGLAPLALGSDSGGSVRQPAALCGVVGIKPSYGRVSRFGLVAFASSLDQIGCFGRCVADAAALLEIIAGDDGRDSTAWQRQPWDLLSRLDGNLEDLRVGVPTQVRQRLPSEVAGLFADACSALQGLGASVHDLDLPLLDVAVPIYMVLANAEASSNLARYDGMRYGMRASGEDLHSTYTNSRGQGFGTEVRRRILLGTFVLSAGYRDAFYVRACRARLQLAQSLESALEDCDLIALPTTPGGAFRLGERLDDPLAMYLSDVFTVPANLAGLPAVSIPMGLDRNGLPLGLQLLARRWDEATMLRAAACYEQVRGPFPVPQP